ncbi:MAG TPA: hypothetical protein DCR68_05215 [Coprothermobacter sp.]|nr:hypothetical protein [Coprothermobacter sp.]
MIVDTETGEILCKWNEVRSTDLFAEGQSAEIREVMISRDILANGMQRVYISTPDGTEEGTYLDKVVTAEELKQSSGKAVSKGRGRTRGELAKVEIAINDESMKKLGKLGNENLGFLVRLASLARFDTGLLAKQRNKPLTYKEILSTLETSERSGSRYINALLKAGVLKQQDGGYYINKQYVAKG